MFSEFKKAYLDKHQDFKVPKEVIASLSEKLPQGIRYEDAGDGLVVPVPDTEATMKIQIKLPKEMGFASLEEVMEYHYRIQKEIEVDEGHLIINDEKIKLNDLIQSPFDDRESVNSKFVIPPKPFQPPFQVKLSVNNESKQVFVKRQPYPSLHESLFECIENGAFSFSYILNEKDSSVKFNFNVNISRAHSVNEIVESLKLFHAFQLGNVEIANQKLPGLPPKQQDKNIEQTIIFWDKVLKLETILGVHFTPELSVPREDALWMERLSISLLENKPFKEFLKIDKITITKTEEFDLDALEITPLMTINFIQKFNLSIMRAEFEIFAVTGLYDFKITELVEDEQNSMSVDLLIEPLTEKGIYQGCKLFTSIEHARKYMNTNKYLNELQNADLLEF